MTGQSFDLRELELARGWIQKSSNLDDLEKARRKILGKKGLLTLYLKALSSVVNQKERIERAKLLNLQKQEVLDQIRRKKEEMLSKPSSDVRVDMTLPTSDDRKAGTLHPLSETMRRCQLISEHMGYSLNEGDCVEDDFHNFDALNIPEYHPARQEVDTFYLDQGLLLRTHTSPVQIRFMKKNKPPFRVASIGRVFRRDSDATHTPVFHQMEAFAVEPGINMGHLKWTVEEFLGTFFEKSRLMLRFRPSYFPFTEPSGEVDLMVRKEGNNIYLATSGEEITENHLWIEILGCGLIHPAVFEQVGLPHQDGFAMGVGIERLAMLKYHISDVRDMFANDFQWIAHYGQSPFQGL